MPTGQPPEPPQIPDVFGGFIDPRIAQQNTLDQFQQSQQAQNQGQKFNGWEGGLGKGAGLLTKFIEGASVGRANADAKTAHGEAMKSAQDASRLNNYIQMVQANQEMDPGAKQVLIEKAYQHQGKMVDTIMKESDNPVMKALHPIFQTIMGGQPANESSKTDSKTGKKSKVKTGYQGPDENVYTSLMDDYHMATQNLTTDKVSTQKSQDILTGANSEIKKLAGILGHEPNQEEVARALRSSPVYNQGEGFARMYGRNNPVADLIGTYAPKESADALLKRTMAEKEIRLGKQEDEYLSGQGTQTPPEAKDFMSRPKGERQQPVFDKLYGEKPQNQAQRDATTPPSAALEKKGGAPKGYMSPSFLAQQVRGGDATQKEETIKVGDSYKQVPIIYAFDGKPRTLDGMPINPEDIGKPVLQTKEGKAFGMKYTGKDGKEQVVLGVETAPGVFKPATIMIDGEPVPVKPVGSQGGMDNTLKMINSHTARLEGMLGTKRTQLEAIANKIKAANPQYQFAMSPEVQAKFDAEVDKAAGPLRDEIKNYSEMIENNKAILKEHGAEDLANSYNSTLKSGDVPDQHMNQLNDLQ